MNLSVAARMSLVIASDQNLQRQPNVHVSILYDNYKPIKVGHGYPFQFLLRQVHQQVCASKFTSLYMQQFRSVPRWLSPRQIHRQHFDQLISTAQPAELKRRIRHSACYLFIRVKEFILINFTRCDKSRDLFEAVCTGWLKTRRHKSVQHRIFNHRNRISVVNFQVLDHIVPGRSHNYRIFNVQPLKCPVQQLSLLF